MGTASHAIDAHPMIMTSPSRFAELYERNYAAVYRAALRVTGNPADAEDALQTVFLRILHRGGRLDSDEMHEAYLRRAAVNAALDLLRRRVTRREEQFEEGMPHAVVESPSLLKERLRRAIASLDPADAEVFLLRYVEGFSNGELAEMFGQEKNHVAVRLHRIRQSLQAEMER
jgi:RNA polymerase sigma-70 factor (ECF subfamily)